MEAHHHVLFPVEIAEFYVQMPFAFDCGQLKIRGGISDFQGHGFS